MHTRKIAVLVGSLRKESFNRKLAIELTRLAPPSLQLDMLDISQLSLYNQDYDDQPPIEWVTFRAQIKPFDGVLLVTPEYNRSYPAVLKNALDIGSRPYGQSIWNGKPCAVVSGSLGTTGGFGANQHLRQVLAYLNMPTLAQPEAYIGQVHQLFDANGKLDANTSKFLHTFIQAFSHWVDLHTQTNDLH